MSTIQLELDEIDSPKTVQELLKNLPFEVSLNVWDEKIYTSKSPIDVPEENAVLCFTQ